MTLQLYLGFWKHLLKFWWPVIIFIFVGLAVLGIIERGDRLNGRDSNN